MRTNADRVRQLREHRAWSQEQLAEIAGINVRTLQRVEAGGGGSLETRMALASALDVTPAELCEPPAEADGGAVAAGPTPSQMPSGPQAPPLGTGAILSALLAILFALMAILGYLFASDYFKRDTRTAAMVVPAGTFAAR